MITLSWQTLIIWFLAVCGGFSTVCVAVVWAIRVVKALKKPSDDNKAKFEVIDQKLDNDNKRIGEMKESIDYIKKTQAQMMKVCLVILEELKTNNDKTGVIGKTEKEIKDFLLSNI